MAYERRDIVGGAVKATLVTGLSDTSVGSFTIDVATGWPTGIFYVVVDRGQPTEEKIKCSARTGTTVTVAVRGADGTSSVAHTPGASVVEIIATAVDLDEANYAVTQTVGKVTTKGDLLAATGASAFARVGTGGSGNDNYALLANSSATAGVAFGLVGPQSISGISGIAKGQLVGATGTNTLAAVSTGTNDYVLIADANGSNTGVKWGQVGTLNISDNAVTAPKINGVSGIAKGGIVTASAADTLAKLAVGTSGQILSVDPDAGSTTGLKWIDKTVTQAQVTFDSVTGGTSSASPSTKPSWLTWTGPATEPVINSGTLEGYTMTVGELVWVHIRLVIASDTTKGTDNNPWKFGLPANAKAGAWQIIPGYVANPDLSVVKPVTGLIRPGLDVDKVGYIATPDGTPVHRQHPWTWNADAVLILEGWYRKA